MIARSFALAAAGTALLCVAVAWGGSAAPPLDTPTWSAFYNGPVGGAPDQGLDLVVADDGAVAITGRSLGDSQNFDYITIRYAPDGTELWSRRFEGPELGVDEAYAVGMDAAGNVIVTGASYNGDPNFGGSDFDYVTIKYEPDGDVAWIRTYNGPGNNWDLPSDMEVDVAGNAYIAGFSFKEPTATGVLATHFHMLKYTPGGEIDWEYHLDLEPHLGAGARDLALDAAGNVYASGVATRYVGGSIDDMYVAKVDAAGNLVYAVNIEAGVDGDALHMFADDAGNAYLTGYADEEIDGFTTNVLPTVKVSPTGEVLWFRTELFGQINVEGTGIVADAQGNVYTVAGIATSENRGVVVSYDAGGAQRWMDIYDVDPADPFNDAWMRAAHIGSDGNLYVDVNAQYDLPEGYDFTCFVYDPASGEVTDTVRIDTGSGSDIATAFELGPDDSLHWTGSTYNGVVTGTDTATVAFIVDPPPATPGDLNNDGVVGPADLAALLALWGACSNCSECTADLDGSCNVGPGDLAEMLANWG
jgi:hypothetical protein